MIIVPYYYLGKLPAQVAVAQTARHDCPRVAWEPAVLGFGTTAVNDNLAVFVVVIMELAQRNGLVDTAVFIDIGSGGSFGSTH